MKKIIILLTLAILQGCSSIPLSTMWKMKSFDEDDFNQIRAQDLRVKFRTDKYVDVTEKSLTLQLKFSSNDEAHESKFELEQIEQGHETKDPWFRKEYKEFYSVLRLSPESMRSFKKLQRSAASLRDSSKNVEFIVNFGFGENEPESYIMSIDLLLNPNQGYFTLFDEVPFGVKNIEKLNKENS
ncbi:MAG: hypothetical protein HWE16_04405 [Gammaproteobacteria bacterium]|nr:hypothetical protein [Gammaproteobacteria bacterium]